MMYLYFIISFENPNNLKLEVANQERNRTLKVCQPFSKQSRFHKFITSGAVPGLSDDGCLDQNNPMVQPFFLPNKAGCFRCNEQNFKIFKEIGFLSTKGFSQDGCLAPVVKVQRVPRNPWHPHWRRPRTYMYYGIADSFLSYACYHDTQIHQLNE